MAITTGDDVVAALATKRQPLVVAKVTVANMIAGGFAALWRATGTPGQGAIPAAAAVPDNTTLGGLTWTNAGGADSSYLAQAALVCGNNASEIQVHDRLAHMGGLSGTVTTAQSVAVDASVVALDARRGAAGYSEVQWWLEWYTDTGATPVNATVAVTYDDNSTGNIVVALAATMRASRRLPVLPAVAGRKIKGVTSVTLSATTAAAGSFGVTASRFLASVPCNLANLSAPMDWAQLGLPRVESNACLELVMLCSTTSTGALYGQVSLVQG